MSIKIKFSFRKKKVKYKLVIQYFTRIFRDRAQISVEVTVKKLKYKLFRLVFKIKQN